MHRFIEERALLMCTGISALLLTKAVGISEGTGEARQHRDRLRSLSLQRLKITATTTGFSHTTSTLIH